MSKTRAQLEAENAAQRDMLAEQRREIEALRGLIAAAAQCADVPIAATDHHASDRLAWMRADKIRAYLSGAAGYDGEYLCEVLARHAQSLREEAASPVTYEVYREQPDPDATAVVAASIAAGTPVIVDDGERTCECGHDVAGHHVNQVTGGSTYCNMCQVGGCGAFRPRHAEPDERPVHPVRPGEPAYPFRPGEDDAGFAAETAHIATGDDPSGDWTGEISRRAARNDGTS